MPTKTPTPPQHASCVALDGKGILIRGASGAGKSSLALILMERGGTLIADDYTLLEARGGQLMASAPAKLRGTIEVRGFGLITVPFLCEAPVRLIVDLVEHTALPRMPDHQSATLKGIAIKRMFLGVHDAAASGKIRAVMDSP